MSNSEGEDAPVDPPSSGLLKSFPLFPRGDLDFFWENEPWPIRVDSRAPSELKRRVAAAFISLFMGQKSIDNVLKRYFRDFEYPDVDADRLDFRIDEELSRCFSLLSNLFVEASFLPSRGDGYAIAEWCLSRVRFSVEIAIHAAHRGGLYECSSIARLMVEQLAWANHIAQQPDDLIDVDARSYSKFSELSQVSPIAGKLYGWLSNHAHFLAAAHAKNFIFNYGKVGHLHASSRFKALSFAVLLILAMAYLDYAKARYSDLFQNFEVFGEKFSNKLDETKVAVSALIFDIIDISPDDSELKILRTIIG